jgi:glycosyltransferase involved in cell wall biosynthesis
LYSCPQVLILSDVSEIIGGAEHSLLDSINALSSSFWPELVVPKEGTLSEAAKKRGIPVHNALFPHVRRTNVFSILNNARRLRLITKPGGIIYSNGIRGATVAMFGKVFGFLENPTVWHVRQISVHPWDRIIGHYTSVVITNSNATANRFRMLRDKVKVIYNGIPLPHLEKKPDYPPEWPGAHSKVILCVGMICPLKRQLNVADIFCRFVAPYDPSIYLVFLGDSKTDVSDYAKKIFEIIEYSPYGNRIVYLGHKENVFEWMAHSRVLAHGCLVEGFGRVLVEAMAVGCPPVAYASGAIPEIIRSEIDGFLAQPGDDNGFGSMLLKLCQDDDLHNTFALNSIKRAQNFSIERHMARIKQLFTELLTDNNRTNLKQ